MKVYKIMKSLVSKGMATEVYNWGYYYYVINEKGVTFVKDYLGYTEERLKPATFMAKADVKTSTAAKETGTRFKTRGGARGGRATEAAEGETETQQPQTAGADQ